MRIKINEADSTFDKVGVLKDGIGVVIKKSKKKLKTPYLKTTFKYNEEDIPVNLQAEKYRFKIPVEKLSDTEYVFKFDKAIMLNKK